MSPAEACLNTSPTDAKQDDVNKRKRTLEIEMEKVTDEEVEEFCAILRRFRRPVRYFGGIEKVKRWRPSFVAEDFNVEGDEGGRPTKVKGNEKVNAGEKGLDLNANPLMSE